MGSLSNLDNQLAEKPFDRHKELERTVGQVGKLSCLGFTVHAHLKAPGKEAAKQNYMVRDINDTTISAERDFTHISQVNLCG